MRKSEELARMFAVKQVKKVLGACGLACLLICRAGLVMFACLFQVFSRINNTAAFNKIILVLVLRVLRTARRAENSSTSSVMRIQNQKATLPLIRNHSHERAGTPIANLLAMRTWYDSSMLSVPRALEKTRGAGCGQWGGRESDPRVTRT